MIGSIARVMSSLKTAKDLAEAMVGLRDAAAFKVKAGEFQSKILDAQQAAFSANEERAALIEKVRELEAEVARVKAWETQKQRYELKDVGLGAMAYALKSDAKGTEPDHCICANCYEDARKSILQPETRFPGRTKVLVCHQCGSELIVSGGRDAVLDRPRQTHAITRRPRG